MTTQTVLDKEDYRSFIYGEPSTMQVRLCGKWQTIYTVTFMTNQLLQIKHSASGKTTDTIEQDNKRFNDWNNNVNNYVYKKSPKIDGHNMTGRKWNEDYTYFESEKDYQCHYVHEQSNEDVTFGTDTMPINPSAEDQHDIYMDPMEIEYLGNLFGVKELTGDVVLKCFTVNSLLDQLESTTLREAVLDVQSIARQIATKSQNELLDCIEQTSEPGQIDCGEIAKVSGTGVRNVQKKVKMLKEKFDKKFSDWL